MILFGGGGCAKSSSCQSKLSWVKLRLSWGWIEVELGLWQYDWVWILPQKGCFRHDKNLNSSTDATMIEIEVTKKELGSVQILHQQVH